MLRFAQAFVLSAVTFLAPLAACAEVIFECNMPVAPQMQQVSLVSERGELRVHTLNHVGSAETGPVISPASWAAKDFRFHYRGDTFQFYLDRGAWAYRIHGSVGVSGYCR